MTSDTAETADDLRVTAPQQAYTTREVGFGFAVLAIGVLVTLVLPILVA